MRHFPDFFASYQEYFGDTFVPPQFNEWTCLSVVAAALERKVWLPWSDSWSCYPNIYVLLTAGPGEGKTQAIRNGIDLLDDANRKAGGTLTILPNQATEAALIKLLGHGRPFQIGTTIVSQSAAYYRAEEASACLRNIYGEFLAMLTDLYDCPNRWSKATIKDGAPIELKNVCVNLIAGSTFDYLGKLVNDENIMGGFASRLIYVESRNKEVKRQVFQGGLNDTVKAERAEFRRALIDDLVEIHRMQGRFTADPEFKDAWEAWWLESERERKAQPSEKLQSLLVRQNLHMLKTSMILSACAGEDRVLKLAHWEHARRLVEPAMQNIPGIFRESRAGAIDKGQTKNLPHAIVNLIIKNPRISRDALRARLQFGGANPRDIDSVLQQMLLTERIRVDSGKFELLGNPNDYL